MPVWRLEFEFRREALSQLNLHGLPSVLEHQSSLWSYATTDWLTLRCPNRKDQTRSRWEIHPLWMLLSSIDWNAPGGPLARTFSPTRAPSTHWLGGRALSLMASTAAINGQRSDHQAGIDLLNMAGAELSRKGAQAGLSSRAFFSDLVEACNRKFNTALNDFEPDPDPTLPDLRNPYYRAKEGLPDRGL